jgi:hypothetical protein
MSIAGLIQVNKWIRAIVTATLIVFLAAAVATNVSAATPPSYFNDCGYPEYKPQSLTEFCADAGNGVTKIKWSSWTSTKAVGTGSFYVKLCDPNCADGKVVWAKAKVVLSGAKFTRGKRYLMNVTVSSTNGKPLPGESKSTSIRWVTDYWMG